MGAAAAAAAASTDECTHKKIKKRPQKEAALAGRQASKECVRFQTYFHIISLFCVCQLSTEYIEKKKREKEKKLTQIASFVAQTDRSGGNKTEM